MNSKYFFEKNLLSTVDEKIKLRRAFWDLNGDSVDQVEKAIELSVNYKDDFLTEPVTVLKDYLNGIFNNYAFLVPAVELAKWATDHYNVARFYEIDENGHFVETIPFAGWMRIPLSFYDVYRIERKFLSMNQDFLENNGWNDEKKDV